MGRGTFGSMIIALGLALGATSVSAQGVKIGGQLSFADDADVGVGPRLAFELPSVVSGLWLASSFDYFFPDQGLNGSGGGDFDYWEINSNLLYDILLADVTNLRPYIGAGLNIARSTVPGESGSISDTKVGLNIVGGFNFPLSGLTPFVEARLEVEGGDQFVIAGGLLFP